MTSHHTSDVLISGRKNSQIEMAEILVERISQVVPATTTINPVQGPVTFAPSTVFECQVQKKPQGRPKLSGTEQQQQKRKYRILSERERELLKSDSETGMTISNMAAKYQISVGSVSKIVKEKIGPKSRGGGVYRKLTPIASKILSTAVFDDKFVTAKKLVGVLQEHGVDVHPSSINRHLKSPIMELHGCPRFSVKRVINQEESRNSTETMLKRKEYVKTYQELANSGCPFIFVDESS